ncbi:hypothetical protein CH298_17815 [Rhodococcoides fascians]|uniref:DUF262 domain-containing protein n=1 Tax=Rhodococcoides fascians TaxID=1828 RepID=UPI000B9ADF53|nr:DUF262 domain-containing protein [Rhodococcus fascians]OZE87214.1 hypothetical protein CH303_18170 [Rhodococcus fascians]OZF14089.1 hypothetical protein CH298_17815 [Rhodococcus fascians]OZF17575.1 hypothetical protein CH297_18200 [Rhodococcus fascians]OZF64165.1 hypothetical protein CH308_18090 [Rhodococcus fascians]OZF66729.1 hypothetical protein CH307_18295 [Rhodococcus fascians]
MTKDFTAGRYAPHRIFSSVYGFTIADYQLSYARSKEQAHQLLEVLKGALAWDTEKPNFLQSIDLIEAGSDPRAEAIGGQQRLTTQVLTQDGWTPAVIKARQTDPWLCLQGMRAELIWP